MKDTRIRSLVKTISWRITGSGATFLISYIILENITVATSIAIIQIIANTVLYFLHERVWAQVNWGKNNQ